MTNTNQLSCSWYEGMRSLVARGCKRSVWIRRQHRGDGACHYGISSAAILGLASLICSLDAAYGQVTLTNLGIPDGGGWSRSTAVSVSGDGSVIVGTLRNYPADEAVFRWTAMTGVQPLPPASAGVRDVCSRVSLDGTTITLYNADWSSGYPTTGFAWSTTNGLIGMPGLPPIDSGTQNGNRAVDSSADGSVLIGNHHGNGNLATRPVRWTSNDAFDIGGTSGIWSQATAVSDDGTTIIGDRFVHTSSGPPYVSQHFRAAILGGGDPDVLPALHATNPPSSAADVSRDGTVICGNASGIGGGTAAVRWWTWGCCVVVEDLGVIQGWPSNPSPGSHPEYSATGISSDGRIIVGGGGQATIGGSAAAAFVWTAAMGMTNLNSHLEALGVDLTNIVLTRALGVSGDGTTIVGTGVFAGLERAFAVHGLHLVPDPCIGDITGNGGIDAIDLAVILGQWGTNGQGEFDADVNDDNLVDGLDLSFVMGGWGPCPD